MFDLSETHDFSALISRSLSLFVSNSHISILTKSCGGIATNKAAIFKSSDGLRPPWELTQPVFPSGWQIGVMSLDDSVDQLSELPKS